MHDKQVCHNIASKIRLLFATISVATTLCLPMLAHAADPVRILISQSPWLNAFVTLVDQYESETGERVQLEVTPFAGMQDKTRNSLRAEQGSYDIVNLNAAGLAEIYDGGFLKPLKDIDPAFELPVGVLDFGGGTSWDVKRHSFGTDGTLLAVPTNGNVQVFYYRKDLYEQAGLTPPKTWDELLANAKKLHNPPERYGFIARGARDSVLFDFTPFLFSYGGSYFANPRGGDFSVTLASPEALEALKMFIKLGKEVGAPNPGALAQAELIQLLTTGKAAQGTAVVAAIGDLLDPNKSLVSDTIEMGLLPAGPSGKHASVAGQWMAAIPKNIPVANQKASLKFLEWFLRKDTQVAYVAAGGIPIRKDLDDTKLADDPAFRFIKPFVDNAAVADMYMPLVQGTELKEMISLYLNRAVIGELSPEDALNQAAKEADKVLSAAGYKLNPPKQL